MAVALELIRGISPRAQCQSRNRGMSENDQNNDQDRRSAILSSKGFSSALVVAKVVVASSCLVAQACDAHQVEHQPLRTFYEWFLSRVEFSRHTSAKLFHDITRT